MKHAGATTTTPSGASQKQRQALTSQRRGSFFGLYKKGGVENQDQNQNKAVGVLPKSTTSSDSFSNPSPAVQKPTPTHATPALVPGRPSTSEEIQPVASMTSQKRGTFFGLYPKSTEENRTPGEEHHGHTTAEEMRFNTIQQQEQQQQSQAQALHLEVTKKDSPEELQSVLQQMYEKKIQTLRNLKASRDQQHPAEIDTY
jgi:hypothetical protein